MHQSRWGQTFSRSNTNKLTAFGALGCVTDVRRERGGGNELDAHPVCVRDGGAACNVRWCGGDKAAVAIKIQLPTLVQMRLSFIR